MSARPIALVAAVVLGVALGPAFAPLAKADSPPRIDIERVCKAGAGAITAIFGDSGQDVVGTCVQDEEAARDQLQQNWAGFPAAAKARCVQPNEYLPSYVEWTACLEITRDVIKMRRDRAAAASSTSYENHDCPIVKTDEDGNLRWIDACPLGRHR